MRRKTIKRYFQLTVEALEECDIRLMPQPRVTTRDNTQKGVGGLYLQTRVKSVSVIVPKRRTFS